MIKVWKFGDFANCEKQNWIAAAAEKFVSGEEGFEAERLGRFEDFYFGDLDLHQSACRSERERAQRHGDLGNIKIEMLNGINILIYYIIIM